MTLSFLNFILNPAIARSELCSNVCISDLKFKLQMYGVASSAKLHISIHFNAKNI